MFSNIIVALSNFIVFFFINNKKRNNFFLFPMMASFVYHLAETKHNLPGIIYLNKYSLLLLNIDRFFAILSGLYVLSNILKTPKQTINFYFIGIIGVICLLYSEKDYFFPNINEIEYIITHSIWHFSAFYCLYNIKKSI